MNRALWHVQLISACSHYIKLIKTTIYADKLNAENKIFKFENKSFDPIQNCRPENQVKKTHKLRLNLSKNLIIKKKICGFCMPEYQTKGNLII